METVDQVINGLKFLGDDKVRKSIERFGIPSEKALGIKIPELRTIAKSLKKRHDIALKLWQSDIHEAKLLASMIADPAQLSAYQMDRWVADIYSWDICDQCCGNLFIRTSHWKGKVHKWISSEREFVRRAGIVLIAEATMHQKNNITDKELLEMLQQATTVANDPRNFVKKAVSWALRQAGKKRPEIRQQVISMAEALRQTGEKTGKWIASDVLRELNKY